MLALAVGLFLSPPTAQAAGPPEVAGGYTTAVKAQGATLNARVNPNGFATNYRFEYVTEAAFLTDGFDGAVQRPAGGANLVAGPSSLPVAVSVGGLTPSTAYRYRLLATNSAGTTAGKPRSFLTAEEGPVLTLPDGRGWEMVSPIDKNGGEISGREDLFGGGVLQAAASGGAVTYSSPASFAGGAGAPGASQYISRRSSGGWGTENITSAVEAGGYGDHPNGVPFQLFSADLGGALMLNPTGCAAAPCARSYSRRDDGPGTFTSLPFAEPDLDFSGALPDLSHLVFSTCAALTANATAIPAGANCDPAEPNLYESSGGAPHLVNLLPGDLQGTPGAALAAQSGAISADGSRIYFTRLEDGGLYLRENATTKLVPETLGGGASFQTASSNGGVAFFTKGAVLYRYDALAQTSTPIAAEVVGVLGASQDGSAVYYLTSAGLFLWRAGAATAIPLAPAVAGAPPQADAGSYPPATGNARVSPDGSHLLFVSSAEMTAYDNKGLAEVYLYSAPTGGTGGSLLCASCRPSGERPSGAASVPGAVANGDGEDATRSYKPRVLAADANLVFFETLDAVIPQHDTNSDRDVYEWRAAGVGACERVEGCVGLISSGRSEGGASFVDASADGADAFFLTDGSLVAGDPGSVDLYDARIGGGFPPPPTPPSCPGDSCQPLPSEPEDPTPGSVRHGEPNPPLPKAKPKPKRCKRGQVKKRGRCVKKAHHKKHRRAHGSGKHRGRQA